jgi:hypothetical protein
MMCSKHVSLRHSPRNTAAVSGLRQQLGTSSHLFFCVLYNSTHGLLQRHLDWSPGSYLTVIPDSSTFDTNFIAKTPRLSGRGIMRLTNTTTVQNMHYASKTRNQLCFELPFSFSVPFSGPVLKVPPRREARVSKSPGKETLLQSLWCGALVTNLFSIRSFIINFGD